ncbi:hypothetical protein ACHAXR_004420 [Thalassiosira sp. AJA248-18]
MSKKSFRSLDDLDDPMTSLLYRPSFSWERGVLDVPHSSSNLGGSGPLPPLLHGGPPPPLHGGGSGPAVGHSHGPPPPPALPPPLPPSSSTTMIQLRDQQKIMKALTMRSEIRTIGNPSSTTTTTSSSQQSIHHGLILLLAMPQDRHCLSETLCIIRNNVEVFTATQEDINAPAPGRKRPIQIGQVGLRCVYCRMCQQRDRVKRATCFPSSMKRIYRAVIDMKLDHFKNCPYVPQGLKVRLDQLQAGSTRSTGMTVQYFVRSAREMGMMDGGSGGGGVCIDLKRVGTNGGGLDEFDGGMMVEGRYHHGHQMQQQQQQNQHEMQGGGGVGGGMVPYGPPPPPDGGDGQQHHGRTYPKQKGRGGGGQQATTKFTSNPHPQVTTSNNAQIIPFQATGGEIADQPGLPEKRYSGKVLLTLPEDTNFLSPLRCFLRNHVCAFTASARDIAVRTPTTFSVRVGQVGVGCIYCLSVPPKARSNRAVCFPFTVGRIYQSVADIQRFHLGECRMMPPDVRNTFLKLQSESAKGSRGLATRTYWVDSAKKIGLSDGPAGMYFYRDPSLAPPPPPPPLPTTDETCEQNLDILAQVASNNDTIGKPRLVAPEDKPTIAEFLYLVMEQLRACRFTDADRNKRRSKNVGSIGVECKHCAGKIDGRKFFWSSVSAAESNFVSVHSHMLGCKYIPEPLKMELTRLKALRREQTSRLKTGSQKAFFTRVWARLHGIEVPAVTSAVKVVSPARKKRTHPKGGLSAMRREVVVDAPMKKAESLNNKATDVHAEPPLLDLPMGRSHDSDEIRALLESKSTLSSMPSVDDESIINELKAGQSSESGENNIIRSAASKSSLTSVALNLSAVSVHCKEEQSNNGKMGEI